MTSDEHASPAEARVTEAEVARIAGLVHLDLEPDERARLAHDLGRILAYVDELASLDQEPPLAPRASSTSGALGAGRDDEPEPGLTQAEALAEAPRARDGAFVVPAFVES